MKKLSELKIGEAILLRKEKNVNDSINESIKEGDFFVEFRMTKDCYLELKLAEQPYLKK